MAGQVPLPIAGPAPAAPAAPDPMSQTEQRGQRLNRLESFYDGLDQIDPKLDPGTREQFQQMVAMGDDGQEMRAAAVNKAYLAYTQPHAREAIESQWDFVRQQAAASLGVNKPAVTDVELYGAIKQHVAEARDRRGMASELVASVQLAALEGETDWRKPYAAFLGANKKPGAPVAHMDDFRQMAEAAAAQIGARAAVIGPAVKTVAGLLAEFKADPNPLKTDASQAREDAIVGALMPLAPADRTLAMQLAAQKTARETPETARGGLEKAGETLSRGLQTLTLGAQNVMNDAATSSIEGESVRPEVLARNQILRELQTAYDATVDPVKGENATTQGLLNLSGMLPQLGLIAQPWVGVPLMLASNTDARQGQLQAEGVPVAQARTVALAQGTVDAALQFVSSNMVLGKFGSLASAPGGSVSAALLKNAAKETAVMAGVTAAQAAGPLAIKEIASKLSEAVPGVDYEREFAAFKHALPETVATLVPMVLLGTGAATFRDVGRMREYTADTTILQAVGFSEEQAVKLAGIADPAARGEAIREQWGQRNMAGEGQTDAVAELDANAEATRERHVQMVERQPDGTYTVRGPDGTELPGITDPAEAQRQADLLADRDSDPAKALTALSTAIKGIETGPEAPATPAPPLGIVPPGAAAVGGWVGKAIQRVKAIAAEVAGGPKFTAFKEALNRWVGTGQLASLEIRATSREITRAVPDPRAREGITAWLQAGGDRATLEHWRDHTTLDSAKTGYERALALTPDEINVAERLRDFYADMLVTLQRHGIVEQGLENYVNQMWKRELPSGEEAPVTGGRLTTQLKNAKERTFGSYFEGEQAGFKPVTKDISKLVAIYANEVSKVIATRQLIKDLTTKKAADGRPLAAPFGNRALVNATEGEPAVIKPLAKDEETMDYRTLDHPALTKWKWIGEHNGADAYLEGQLGLHPEIYAHMKAALGKSIIREWYDRPAGPLATLFKDTVHGIDKLGQITKGTMLGFFSPFHQVQEGVHAIGHKINPLTNLPDLDPSAPSVRRAVTHGLMLAGDNEAMAQFEDSINDPNPFHRIPVIGEMAKGYGEWLFHEYIPRLKLKTWEAITDRNSERYADDLAAKRTTQDEIDYLSAQQTNAAYGHLNYADLGRDPTLQHFMRMVLLAPDFLEARARFTGQAFKGAVGAKAGREQLTAFALLAATQWLTARVLNKTLDDDWHADEPFNVVVGNRRYTMRSVPEDLWKLFEDPRRFTMGRISPLIGRGIFQLGTGKNWRGERLSYTDTFAELATAWIPISLRSAPGLRSLTESDKANPISPWEQFVGSLGLHISRHSPIAEAYKLAGAYNKAQGKKEDTGTYPVSKYQALRYALEDGDAERAADALSKLKSGGAKKLSEGFHESLFHHFTGSAVTDHAFKESLSPDDKALVEHAEAMRQAIWLRYNLLLQQTAHSPNNN